MTPSAWKPVDEAAAAWKPVTETPSALSRLGSAFWEGIGGKALTDIALGGTSLDPEVRKKGMDTVKSLVNGIKGEPGRMWDELSQSGQSMLSGHPVDAVSHIAKAVPVVGWGAANVQHDFENGDYATGFGHAMALLLPFAVKSGAVSSLAESVPRGAKAVVEGAKAAAPDVAAGAGKVAAGAVASEILPGGPLKYVAGAAPVHFGVRQIGRGLSKGLAAGKASLAERLQSATEAMAAPEAAAADEAVLKFSGLSAEELKGLKPEEQAAIRNLAANAQPPAKTPVATAAAPAPSPSAPATPAPQSIAEMIQAEIAARSSQPQLPGRTPLRPPLAPPAPPPPKSATVPPASGPRTPLSPPVGPAPPQSLAEAVAPPPASGSGGQAIPEQVVYRSTKHPGEGISLNNQGMLYTSPDEAYSKNFGPHTQKLAIAPKNTLDLSKAFAADEGITAERMKAFMERNGVSISEELMRDFHAAEGAGGEVLQHFGQFGQKRLVSALQAAGYDSAKIPEYVEGGGKSVSIILFDKSLARPARSLAQTEAAMAQKAPAPLEPPTSQYTSTGEKKSPELRAAEITGANVAAKAQRFIQALHDAGVTSADARSIPVGRLSLKQIEEGGVPGWGNVTDDLVSKGVLKAGENPPSQSIPEIVKGLKKLEAQKIAAELADEMKRSGTIK